MRKVVKIQGARDAGILNGWSMPAEAGEFARVNVIYGGNGSGKSTLARVFSQMTHKDPTDVALHIDIAGSDGGSRRVTDRSDGFWSRLRVFDKNFVQKNLLFDVNGRSDALPLRDGSADLVVARTAIGCAARRTDTDCAGRRRVVLSSLMVVGLS